MFKNLWLATVREPMPVRPTAALEGRGDGSSRALLVRRNKGRLAGSQHQTPTRATEASENQISPRSAEGGDCGTGGNQKLLDREQDWRKKTAYQVGGDSFAVSPSHPTDLGCSGFVP